MVFADDERFAFDKVVVNCSAAHIHLAGFYGGRRQIVGRGDLAVRIGGYWELSGAILRVCGELIESRVCASRSQPLV